MFDFPFGTKFFEITKLGFPQTAPPSKSSEIFSSIHLPIFPLSHMATETKAVESPVKKDGVVANSAKETEKKEAPVSDDGDSEEENESPVSERPKRIIKKVEPHILHTPSSRSSRSKPVSVLQVEKVLIFLLYFF